MYSQSLVRIVHLAEQDPIWHWAISCFSWSVISCVLIKIIKQVKSISGHFLLLISMSCQGLKLTFLPVLQLGLKLWHLVRTKLWRGTFKFHKPFCSSISFVWSTSKMNQVMRLYTHTHRAAGHASITTKNLERGIKQKHHCLNHSFKFFKVYKVMLFQPYDLVMSNSLMLLQCKTTKYNSQQMLRYSLKYYLVPEGGKDYKAVTEKPDVQGKNAWYSWVLEVYSNN